MLRIGPRGTGAKAGRLIGGSVLLQLRDVPLRGEEFWNAQGCQNVCLLGQNVLLYLCVNLKLNGNISLALERELAPLGPSPFPTSFLRALPMEHQGTNPSEATEHPSVSTPGAHLKLHRTLRASSSFFVVRAFKIYSLSSFEVCTVLLAVLPILCN